MPRAVEGKLAGPVFGFADASPGGAHLIERVQGRVEPADITGMMFVVVKLHRLGIDVRFQGVVGVWKRRKDVAVGLRIPAEVLGRHGAGGGRQGRCGLPCRAADTGQGCGADAQRGEHLSPGWVGSRRHRRAA